MFKYSSKSNNIIGNSLKSINEDFGSKKYELKLAEDISLYGDYNVGDILLITNEDNINKMYVIIDESYIVAPLEYFNIFLSKNFISDRSINILYKLIEGYTIVKIGCINKDIIKRYHEYILKQA